jgi:hypothetical protein
MYVETWSTRTKIIGQIAEFRRTGSLLASAVTVGIKAQKGNIQLLGAHAQTITSAQPVFYFIPPKQEAEAGVNAGDLILMRLEEKSTRRQFEIAAAGVWRASSGISLTHQIQLIRTEEQPGVYKLMPARELEQGEYALYLSRGEGMAPLRVRLQRTGICSDSECTVFGFTRWTSFGSTTVQHRFQSTDIESGNQTADFLQFIDRCVL